MALLKNAYGEYNYHFNWVNEKGHVTGFNDVWATNKREAIKLAKKMERQPRWSKWDETVRCYVDVDASTNGATYIEAMLVHVPSMYKATRKQADDMDRLGWMMTN
jgi:hypothetical protein